MTPEQHIQHVKPLVWLVQTKLHPGATLADRVRLMRYRRRKTAKTVEPTKTQET